MAGMKYTQEGKRDLRLDFLRGFCLFAMAINHGGFDSYWQIITGGSVFLINAAEGFFFISGMTLALFFMVTFVSLAPGGTSSPAWTAEGSNLEGVFADVCRNMFEEGGELEGVYVELCGDYIEE